MIMANLAKSWLIMVSLSTILHGHGILAMVMTRSWQDLGKDNKELAMASNTENFCKIWLNILDKTADIV